MSDKKAKIIIIITGVISLITVMLFIGLSSPHIMGKDEIYITTAVNDEKISINDSDKLDLMRIPGIGETTADKIIAYREENGSFTKTEDLMNIKGIGEKTYKRILPFIEI